MGEGEEDDEDGVDGEGRDQVSGTVTFETDYSVYQLTLLAGNTAGHALTGGHKQALRHASETPLSGERVQYRALSRCAAHTHMYTHTHTHETRGKAIRHVSPSSTHGTSFHLLSALPRPRRPSPDESKNGTHKR